jgi:hypothetical protein
MKAIMAACQKLACLLIFFGIFRAEDFLVNEVDMDGNIVHLTSLEAPNTKTKVSTNFDKCTRLI